MKKVIILIIALLLVLSLMACGASSEKEQTDAQQTSTDQLGGEMSEPEETTIPESEDNTSVQTEPTIPEETGAPTAESPEKDDDSTFSMKGTIEETVLVDEKGVKITATELTFERNGVELTLLFENNTDKKLSFTTGTLGYSCNSINGYMVDTGYLNATIQPGKKGYDTIFYRYDSLSVYGIREIAEIGIGIQVKDEDYDVVLTTEPVFLKTSIEETYDWKSESFSKAINSPRLQGTLNYNVEYFNDSQIYNQEEISVSSVAIIKNSSDEEYLMVEVENTSETAVVAVLGNIYVNDVVVCGGVWSSDLVLPGKKAVFDVDLSYLTDKQEISILGINSIGKLSFELEIDDTDYEIISEPQEVILSVSMVESKPSGDLISDKNGIRVYYVGCDEDDSSYQNDIHLFLLIENSTDEKVYADLDWNSVSIDGIMIDDSTYSTIIAAGKMGVLDIKLDEDSLKKAGITGIDDIRNVEFKLEIHDSKYHYLIEDIFTILPDE
jgi:hypothetical protein